MLFCPQFSSEARAASYNVSHTFWFYPGWWPDPYWPYPPPWWWPTMNAVGQTWAYARANDVRHGSFVSQSDYDWAWLGGWPPGGGVQSDAYAVSAHNYADGHASAALWGFGPWGLTWGQVRAWGQAHAGCPGSAYANSAASIWFWYPSWRYGWVRWWPWLTVSGSASETVHYHRDPISYQFYDGDTNNPVSAPVSVLHNTFVQDGNTYFEVTTNGIVRFVAPTVWPNPLAPATNSWQISLSDKPGQNYIPDELEGSLYLEFVTSNTLFGVSTIVTRAEKSGQFALWELPEVGLLPGGGWTNSIPLPNDGLIDVGFDFGTDTFAGIFLDNFGEISAIPEPSSWALVGAGLLLLVWRLRCKNNG